MLGDLFFEMLALLGVILLGGIISITTVFIAGTLFFIIKGLFAVIKENKENKNDLS